MKVPIEVPIEDPVEVPVKASVKKRSSEDTQICDAANDDGQVINSRKFH